MGIVLMNLGRSKWTNQVAVIVWSFFAIGLLIQAYILIAKNGQWYLSELLYALVATCFCFFIVRGFKMEIRKGGIHYNANSFKWDKIESYRWKGEESYILGLNLKGDGFPFWMDSYKISISQKEAVDKLLAQHLSIA